MSNGNHRSFSSTPCGDFGVFCIEITIFITNGWLSTLNKCWFQKSVSFSRSAVFLFAGAFVAARNQPRPWSKMIGISELRHHHTCFCNDSFSTASTYTGDFINQFYVFFNRFCFFLISSSISAIDEERKSMCWSCNFNICIWCVPTLPFNARCNWSSFSVSFPFARVDKYSGLVLPSIKAWRI